MTILIRTNLFLAMAFVLSGSLAVSSHAMAADAANAMLAINQVGDIDLTCEEISQEVNDMQDLIQEALNDQDNGNMTKRGMGVVETVGTYAVGSLGGAIGIMAAGLVVSHAANDRVEDAENIIDAAAQRRSFMAGIYNVKGCTGPLDLADIEPAAGHEKGADASYERKPRYND